MSKRPDRFVLAQGSMDGACFLYSVANATKALTSKKDVHAQHWTDMLGSLTRVGDFMDQQVGTENWDPHPKKLLAKVRRMVQALAPAHAMAVSLVDDDDLTGKRIAALIGPDSVLVVGTLEHWVCAVDVDHKAGQLLVADSSQLHEVEHYSEQKGKYGRISNNTWSARPQQRYIRAFRISMTC